MRLYSLTFHSAILRRALELKAQAESGCRLIYPLQGACFCDMLYVALSVSDGRVKKNPQGSLLNDSLRKGRDLPVKRI